MKLIPLTQGKFAMVDDDAPAWIFEVSWCARQSPKNENLFYACRGVYIGGGKSKLQYLHAVIAGTPPGHETLHLDGDGLNNCRYNLCVGSSTQNHQGKLKRFKNNTSGFRGVIFHKAAQRYAARIQVSGRCLHVGLFNSAEDAAQARDAKARELGWPEEGMNFPCVA